LFAWLTLPSPLPIAFSSTLTYDPTHSLQLSTTLWWQAFVVSMSARERWELWEPLGTLGTMGTFLNFWGLGNFGNFWEPLGTLGFVYYAFTLLMSTTLLPITFSSTLTCDPIHSLRSSAAQRWQAFVVSMSELWELWEPLGTLVTFGNFGFCLLGLCY
jgi:hypothetical protein